MPIEITKTQSSLENITTFQFAEFSEGPETVKIRLGNFDRLPLTSSLLMDINM